MLRALVALTIASATAVAVWTISGRTSAQSSSVELRHSPATHEIAVSVAGRPFTVYRYGSDFRDKPVFYPVLAPNGARVNREFPMVTGLAGESSDHLHHQSLWFAYDEVNGTNFWNQEKSARRIEQLEVVTDGAALTARLAWKNGDGAVVLEETKRVTFGGGPDVAWLDHDSTLAAINVPVSMGDTKEGAFGLRLNDSLKEEGGSGRYVNAEGLETERGVWGRTSDWAAIRGTIADGGTTRDVTVAIFAPRSGTNPPPYWHTRAYGLFAVNPLGRKAFDPEQPERITRLGVGESVRTRFRLAVYDGQVTTERLAADFASIK
jgi:hypothetical protein